MKNAKVILAVLPILVGMSLSCKFLKDQSPAIVSGSPQVDFSAPAKGLDVKVEVDKKQTSSGKIGPAGGSVSLTASDGSQFTLDVPAEALGSETTITMTAVRSIEGTPLDSTTPTAVQLEPSGLLFKQIATLTIKPSREIPLRDQIVFGYESDGKDYHIAPVDPESKEIKVQLLGFSGAGVASGSDSAWAAHLAIEASGARTRLIQKIAAATQTERRAEDGGETAKSSKEVLKPILDDYKDQVVLKAIASAELDCKHAQAALNDLIFLERWLQLLGFADSGTGSPGFKERETRLKEIGSKCKKAAFQIVGGLDDWQTSTKVCDIMQPFKLTGGGFTMQLSGGLTGTYTYSGPYAASGTGTYSISLPDGFDKPGTMTGTGEGTAAGYTGSGTEKYTLTPIPPCEQ